MSVITNHFGWNRLNMVLFGTEFIDIINKTKKGRGENSRVRIMFIMLNHTN